MAFKGKPPGSGSGEMSRRTVALRPAIALPPKQRDEARRLRRLGHEPAQIAEIIGAPQEEVEKALVQMRMPRPEPLWQTMDRLLDELLRHRAAEAVRARRRHEGNGELPLFPET